MRPRDAFIGHAARVAETVVHCSGSAAAIPAVVIGNRAIAGVAPGSAFAAIAVEVAAVAQIHHIAIVPIMAAVPVAAAISATKISAAIVDATVESDRQSPIAWIPAPVAVIRTPITRRPKRAYIRRSGPFAGHPVPAVIPVPITGSPDVAVFGNGRLIVGVVG